MQLALKGGHPLPKIVIKLVDGLVVLLAYGGVECAHDLDLLGSGVICILNVDRVPSLQSLATEALGVAVAELLLPLYT